MLDKLAIINRNMRFSFEDIVSGLAQSIGDVFAVTWWFFVPIILFLVFLAAWLFYVRKKNLESIKWVLLKITPPREVQKTPKAMEQVFAAFNSTYSFGARFRDKYFGGKQEGWGSFELVGDASGVHFYVRVVEGVRNLIESSIYAQYPNAEIEVVDDYVEDLPEVLPNDNYDLFGTEFVLARDSAYPFRTYVSFEAEARGEEEKLDTVAVMMETMARLKEGERIWLQILVRPTNSDWKKKSEAVRDDLMGRGGEESASFVALSKGEREVITAIDDKATKIGFECVIRFVFIDNKDHFSRDHIAAVMGAFQHMNTMDLNSFMPNLDTMTITRGIFRDIFKKRRIYNKKRSIYNAYRSRIFPGYIGSSSDKFSIFNIEELATLYHFPSISVGAPNIASVEFKKGAPPSNLPTE